MEFGQILMIIGIVTLVDSIIALSFPKFAVKLCKKMGFKKFCTTPEKVKSVASWEFVIAIIIFIVGMNL